MDTNRFSWPGTSSDPSHLLIFSEIVNVANVCVANSSKTILIVVQSFSSFSLFFINFKFTVFWSLSLSYNMIFIHFHPSLLLFTSGGRRGGGGGKGRMSPADSHLI